MPVYVANVRFEAADDDAARVEIDEIQAGDVEVVSAYGPNVVLVTPPEVVEEFNPARRADEE